MTKSKILTVALIVVLAALAVSAWFTFGTTAAGIEYANAEKYTAGDTTVTGTVENLFIDWTSGEVNIEYHNGDGIFISETSKKPIAEDDKLRWWLDGTTLRIRYAKSGFRISFNLEKQLTVSLPEGTVLKSADISSTSGDLKIPYLAADEIRLGSTSGNVSAVTATGKLTAASTSGDVDVRQTADIDTADLDSTSGSISCELVNVKTLTANSTSGGIRAAVTGKAGTVKIGSTSGNVYPEIASADKVEISSTSGSVSGTVAAFADLKVGSTSGNVTLKLPAEPGLTLKTGTGSGSFGSGIALEKNKDAYTCGDGSARCEISTTSGDIRIDPVK
ncbi:MAG: DUF4097 family beta strand repeat-containing protein [Eubacteriales bacterium]